ncbi:MAG TPA: hypothetical protein PLJ26_01415 [Candidatus Omnitrophota bacterium]|nr:hypothetical protein [Candidatus Omnitrophota bacterium]HQJ15133.1 hypothetical protein [Candidatus Omnitrophota bacterium]
MCPKCDTYHAAIYKTCTKCGSALRAADEILGRKDLIATLTGFIIILFVSLCLNVAMRAFGQN